MALDRLLGSWHITMHHSQVREPVFGTQEYERTLDGAFVVQRWTYDHPDFPNAIAIMDEHSYHYFDVRGVIRIFDFEIDDHGWTMTHLEDEFSQRSTALFRGPDALECHGEYSDDRGATWHHDYRMSYARV